jgi:hypothetical protein
MCQEILLVIKPDQCCSRCTGRSALKSAERQKPGNPGRTLARLTRGMSSGHYWTRGFERSHFVRTVALAAADHPRRRNSSPPALPTTAASETHHHQPAGTTVAVATISTCAADDLCRTQPVRSPRLSPPRCRPIPPATAKSEIVFVLYDSLYCMISCWALAAARIALHL